jgi:hypothetical protein
MRSEEAKELDELLRAGLASYSIAEPRLGMEQRILRSVLEQEAPRRVWWPWTTGAVATASVLIVIALTLLHPKTVTAPGVATVAPMAQRAVVTHPETTELTTVVVAPRRHSSGMGARHARTSAPQKTSEDFLFPAAQTLTQEEALVVAVVEMRPVEVSKALEEAQTRSLEPVRVAAIHIEPLRQDGVRQEE